MTSIDFGKVERYIEDKGFGFVSRNFSGQLYGGEVFFHIKTVKRTNPKLAQELKSFDPYDAPYFWYELESTGKGAQVTTLIDPRTIAKRHAAESARITDAITKILVNENERLNIFGRFPPLSEAIIKAASEFIPKDELMRLEKERSALEAKKNKVWQELEDIKKAERKEAEDKKAAQVKIEEEEFSLLVKEISKLGFTHSKQVSEYIVRNRLGHKYKNISGVLQMQVRGTEWSFNGGFPPNIYARLCCELDLENQGSEAKPKGFRSYKELYGDEP